MDALTGLGVLEYVWLAPLIPLLCFVIAGFFGNRTPQGGGYIAIFGALAAFVVALLASYEYVMSDAYSAGEAFVRDLEWLVFGDYALNFGVYIDSLSCIMMLFASFISLLIFIYSVGYMDGEGKKKRRYYAEVSLFLTGMLGLVVSSNYLQMFIFWEIMGLCSYLLIGFWGFDHPEGDEATENAASAAKKAFLVTRLGDVCLLAGLFILLHMFGTLDYEGMFMQAKIDAVVAANPVKFPVAMALVFGGAIGKSAQFPLHDWLPDAMAGPTTVSALIHAATMVKGGVFLVARSFPLFVQSADVMLFVAIIGGVTAVFTATMALNNMNIKRVLAYSTLSQLGYMVLSLGAGGYLVAMGMETGNAELIGLGVLGYSAGVFHMVNHAFFKALLFLGSGSVIHSTGTEDMRLMGGLGKKMKITSITMLLGSLSIAGFPFFSGFWSKDLVLETALAPASHGLGAEHWFTLLFALGMITAFMTAFYMFRMWFLTFAGKPRERAVLSHGESPKSMTMPLVILSIFAVGSGLAIFANFLCHAAQSLEVGMRWIMDAGRVGINEHVYDGIAVVKHMFGNVWTYVAIALTLVGMAIAHAVYAKRKFEPEAFRIENKGRLYKLVANRYYAPEIYNQISWKLGAGVAKAVDLTDRKVVDGAVNGIANAIIGAGDAVSMSQTGYVRNYAGVVVLGVVVLAVVFVLAFALTGGI